MEENIMNEVIETVVTEETGSGFDPGSFALGIGATVAIGGIIAAGRWGMKKLTRHILDKQTVEVIQIEETFDEEFDMEEEPKEISEN